ncbi:hypothetical protein KIW84_062885 [Lathyrus oleraceus]|uniref:Uncharacterized protein n=1 Tax=Pisum sativum TaxID=3888 RepID=A0A9D4W8C6_PEA|nr:hypothetical protein KIW84_062885 [Pisum sativum]
MKVDQANRSRTQLRQVIVDCEAELAAICPGIGKCHVHIRQSDQNAGSLKEEHARILPQLGEMRKQKIERRNQKMVLDLMFLIQEMVLFVNLADQDLETLLPECIAAKIKLDIPLSDTRPLNLLIKVQAPLKLLMLQRVLYKKLQKKVAQVNQNEGRTPSNGKVRSHLLNDESRANYTSTCQDESMVEHMNKEDMDKHITKLTDELESANRKCEIYRSNLLSILKAVEDVSKILHKHLMQHKFTNSVICHEKLEQGLRSLPFVMT